MPLITITERYSVNLCRAHPDCFFIFGDNKMRVGKGGQAIIRDEPNAIGVSTKWKPAMDEASYFTDANLKDNMELVLGDLARVEALLITDHTVFFPSTGIGNGLAEMPQRAPKTYKLLMVRIGDLAYHYQFNERTYMNPKDIVHPGPIPFSPT